MKFYIKLKLLKADYINYSFNFELNKERENGVWGKIILSPENFNKIFAEIILKEDFIDKIYFNYFDIKILGYFREFPVSEIVYDWYNIEIEIIKVIQNNKPIIVNEKDNSIFNSNLSRSEKEFTELTLTYGGF